MRGQLARILQAAVDALPEVYRSVFVLREIEQLSTTENVGASVGESYAFMGARCDRTVATVMERIRGAPGSGRRPRELE